jgi:hypothetical protein
MTDYPPYVEFLASRMCGCSGGPGWDDVDERQKANWRLNVFHTLAELEALGWLIAPAEMTDEMVEAFCNLHYLAFDFIRDESRRTTRQAWTRAINARPK